MIDLRLLDGWRNAEWEAMISAGERFNHRDAGAFVIPSPVDQLPLHCIVSAARGGGPPWDHVSVSRGDRCPDWTEMDYLARIFLLPHEVGLQFHVPVDDHVNHHPTCLHIWRYAGMSKIPRPPSIMVGPDSAKGRKP